MLSFSSGSWQSDLINSAGVTQTLVPGYAREASAILPRLYLSDVVTAQDVGELKKLGITHVLSVMEVAPTWPEDVEARFVGRMHIKIRDTMNTNILKWLDGTTEFIKGALESSEEHKVLVHCFQGMSRSTTVVCAYLIATLGMSHTKSISYVKARRAIARPNVGFVKQLETYAMKYEGLTPSHHERSEGMGVKVSRIVKKMRGKTTVEETRVSTVSVKQSAGDVAVREVHETAHVSLPTPPTTDAREDS
ncbi:phosphotyrosine protein phosphatases II [Gloeophyllum trabeum ATCC 11539]|uniref:protein-tyrosine-phosphatase n=1 Tax=Gloeophyllum trabeum (strain ATCC 11539 / FP-39264 / Madison 617) TaxID=670483 RepID=S7RPU5_GLOTA|nr:phosphotyrosine protein phosphatases II [Gloeophyllum trabeum ATCC 11539]EPQ56595.1 phosphotyrosine protein phosphatases II [Gloeophyllum trabeum ATCC 11539]